MTLLAPLFAWLLPLALLPVAFHLFFRIRKQPRVFPSLLFFLAADPRLHARRKLREWLVLLLRTLALALLLLALARPHRPGWGGGEARVVVVLDNSASMAAADGEGRTRLSRALGAATALLQDPAVKQAAVVTTVRDPAVALPDGFTEDLAGLRAALAGVRTTHAGGDAAGSLQQAAALSRSVLRGAPEAHLFSDLQAAEWGVPLAAPVAFGRGAAVAVHAVGGDGDRPGPVALLPPPPPGRRLTAGRPWRLDLRVRNAGASEAPVNVNLAAGEARLRESATVAAGQTRPVRLTLSGLAAGEHLLRVWLDGPAAGPSSEAWMVARVAPPDDVWLVGDAADYGALGLALAPAPDGQLTGLRATAMAPDRLAGAGAARAPVLIAATFRQMADSRVAAACRERVAAGANLLVCPAPGDAAAAALPEWCGVTILPALGGAPAGEALVAFQPEAALWDDLRDEHGGVPLRGARLLRWFAIEPRPREGAAALAGTAGGQAVLARTPLGRGAVYVSGCAWDPRWSNLPRRALFLPLALALARPAEPEPPAALALLAGAPLPPERRAAAAAVRLRTAAGDVTSWSGRLADLRAPARAGVFRVEGVAPGLTLAVAGDPAECVPARAAGGSLPGLAGTPYRLFACRDAAGTLRDVQTARRGRSLFGPLLALAALCWLAELWLVNQRPARA